MAAALAEGGDGEAASIFSLDENHLDFLKHERPESMSPIIPESEFTKIVGLVEDIFVSEDFQIRHSEFFTQHCSQFSRGTDPPLGSSELEALTRKRFSIFRTYSVDTATILQTELQRSLGEQFEIDGFIQEIERRTQLAESAFLAQEKVSSGGGSGSSSGSTSPRSITTTATGERMQWEDTVSTDDVTNIYDDGGEIFEMLLTLKDYARFQELMGDYLEMVRGTGPDIIGLVSLRHLSSDEDDDTASYN